MTVVDAWRLADENGIRIYYYPVGDVGVATPDGCIGVDPDYETAELLMHEMGHVMTGAFYWIGAPDCVVRKAERLADRWELERLVPKAQLDELVRQCGWVSVWRVAEAFGVSVTTAQQAVERYEAIKNEHC